MLLTDLQTCLTIKIIIVSTIKLIDIKQVSDTKKQQNHNTKQLNNLITD